MRPRDRKFVNNGVAIVGGLALLVASAHAAAASDMSLPNGDSPEFRAGMLDWAAPAEARPAVEVVTVSPSGSQHRPANKLIVSSSFGWRSDPLHGGLRRHSGVDLPGTRHASVFATGAGTVRIAGWVRGYGKLIEIEHAGGVRTRFGHLSEILVRPGQFVRSGETIGKMGSTGRSTGVHLHYEVRVNGAPVNPLDHLGIGGGGDYAIERVRWSPEHTATARWGGWNSAEAANGLPRSSIR